MVRENNGNKMKSWKERKIELVEEIELFLKGMDIYLEEIAGVKEIIEKSDSETECIEKLRDHIEKLVTPWFKDQVREFLENLGLKI